MKIFYKEILLQNTENKDKIKHIQIKASQNIYVEQESSQKNGVRKEKE